MKISRDQLVAVGKLLSTAEGKSVDRVELGGQTVSAQAARDAFEQAERAPAGPPGVIERTIHKMESKTESAEQLLARNTVTRFILDHIKPVEDLVDHEKLALHFADGSTKDVALDVVNTSFNRAIHDVAIAEGLFAVAPVVGSLGYAGGAVATALMALGAKVTGRSDAARMLWQTAETSFFRLVGTAVPFAGHLVDALVVAMESKARAQLMHPATVGDMLRA
jgi:hypothetical protein